MSLTLEEKLMKLAMTAPSEKPITREDLYKLLINNGPGIKRG